MTSLRPIIAHTTDLSGADRAAFHHACALAAAGGARLVTVHGRGRPVEPERWPDAAPLAARWGRPIEQERIYHDACDDVADTVIDAVRRLAPDVVVAGTHARHGLAALLAGSVAEAVARNAKMATLVVPNGAPGFVDIDSGAIDLAPVLVPAGGEEEAALGMKAARSFAALAGVRTPELITFHADPSQVVGAILDAARLHRARLIVMATRGHDGLRDVLRGSHTEQVLRDAGCPLLAVPLG